MKFYIVGPKKKEEEYEKLEKALIKEGHEVLNILRVKKQLPHLSTEESSKMQHALMAVSDGVFAAADWKKNDVSHDEVMYALDHNINVLFEVREELPFM